MTKTILAATMIVAASAVPAAAQITPGTKTITTLNSPLPAGTSWGVIATENSGGGSGTLTAQNVNDTDGSLNITGDKARVQTGVQYSPFTTNTGVLANSIVDLTANYFINALGANTAATPALRVLIQDGAVRSELIWEGSYNNSTGLGAGSADAGDNFRQVVTGPTFDPANPGAYLFKTLAAWGDTYSSNAFVSALSIGVGSGAGSGFNANVDNLAFATDAGTTRYNFALPSVAAAVPEPASWAMMIGGFGMVGGTMRRRQKVKTTVRFA